MKHYDVIISDKAYNDMEDIYNYINEKLHAAGYREIPIPDDLIDDLAKAIKGKHLYDPVFTQSTNDRRHTETSFYKSWRNFIREMDIAMGAVVHRNKITKTMLDPNLCPYYLRHTYCTDLQDAGVPINVARYLMGHSDISVTAKIYTHTTSNVIDDAVAKINAKNDKNNAKNNAKNSHTANKAI